MSLAIIPIASIPVYYEPNDAASLSADGRLLAYTTLPASGSYQIQIRDLNTGVVTTVAKPEGTKNLSSPALSADGSKLAFRASGDDGVHQVYVTDLATGQTQLVSKNAQGATANAFVSTISLSANGRYLVFESKADNLVPGDTNKRTDVFWKDLGTGEIRIASSTSQGMVGSGFSNDPNISADGQSVVFASNSVNLLGAARDEIHVYVKNMATGTLRFADADANGSLKSVSNLGANPLISADGNKVVFHHYNGSVYLKDLQTGSLVNVAVNGNDQAISGSPKVQAFSSDGRYVTFHTQRGEVYQKDVQTGVLTRVNPNPVSDGTSYDVAIAASADGQTVLVGSRGIGFGSIALPLKDSFDSGLFAIKLNGVQYNGGNEGYAATAANEQLAGGNGNDSYLINAGTTTVLESTNGGTDTIKSYLSNYTLPANVENLMLAENNSGSNGTGNNLGNTITGNTGSNVLLGMGGNDILDGGAGSQPYSGRNDTFDGGSGVDVVVYQTESSSSIVTKVANGYSVARTKYFTGTDLLQNIERIQFTDQVMSLPGDINAAQAYRIYQAAFNRTPDATGLGFWVKQIDNGASLTDVAKGFMQSAEFKAMYGAQPPHAEMVNKFYQNVLHRAPDASGLAFWTDVLNSGRGTPEYVLAQFAESPENQAALIGVTGVGFTFKPFG